MTEVLASEKVMSLCYRLLSGEEWWVCHIKWDGRLHKEKVVKGICVWPENVLVLKIILKLSSNSHDNKYLTWWLVFKNFLRFLVKPLDIPWFLHVYLPCPLKFCSKIWTKTMILCLTSVLCSSCRVGKRDHGEEGRDAFISKGLLQATSFSVRLWLHEQYIWEGLNLLIHIMNCRRRLGDIYCQEGEQLETH